MSLEKPKAFKISHLMGIQKERNLKLHSYRVNFFSIKKFEMRHSLSSRLEKGVKGKLH